MSGRSIFVLAVVLVAFNDLLPSGRQIDDITYDVARTPAYVAHEVGFDAASLGWDFNGVRQQFRDAPAVAQSLWSRIDSDARVVYADARADARHAAERLTPRGDAR
jgi:hypothetical protein